LHKIGADGEQRVMSELSLAAKPGKNANIKFQTTLLRERKSDQVTLSFLMNTRFTMDNIVSKAVHPDLVTSITHNP